MISLVVWMITLTLKLQSFMIKIGELICYQILIFIAPLLYYQIKLKCIIMPITVIFLPFTNFILTYSHFLKTPSGNVLILSNSKPLASSILFQ